MSIPEEASKLAVSDSLIPENITQLPQREDDPESSPFMISLARYNEKECGIDNIDKKRAVKALKLIREIGVNTYSESDLRSLKLKPVYPNGDYKKLYKGLPLDIEIKELFIDSDKGRIFFFTLQKIFYLISITDSHYNTH
ncbi:MAG: hypothetical protein WC793_01360 [Candidatus Paceibacterota bacterium]|jgi:hypothetical protein